MHPFEKNARARLEANAQQAARAIGCDIAHVIALAAEQMRVLAESIEKGRADDAADLAAARPVVNSLAVCGQEDHAGRESNASTIRRGERNACVEELRAMAAAANRVGYGTTFEGGIDAQDTARIIEAAARELESAFTVEADYKPDIAAIMAPGKEL